MDNNFKLVKATSIDQTNDENDENEEDDEENSLHGDEKFLNRDSLSTSKILAANNNALQNEIRVNTYGVKPPTAVHSNLGMLEMPPVKQDSFLTRLTDKNMYKNYFHQFKSLNLGSSLSSPLSTSFSNLSPHSSATNYNNNNNNKHGNKYNYNMLLACDESETTNSGRRSGGGYDKLNTNNNASDFEEFEVERFDVKPAAASQPSLLKIANKFRYTNNHKNRNHNFNTAATTTNNNRSKNLSFDEKFMRHHADSDEENATSLLSTSLNTRRT